MAGQVILKRFADKHPISFGNNNPIKRVLASRAVPHSIRSNLNLYHIDLVMGGLAPPLALSREYNKEMKSPTWNEETFQQFYKPKILSSYDTDQLSLDDLDHLMKWLKHDTNVIIFTLENAFRPVLGEYLNNLGYKVLIK